LIVSSRVSLVAFLALACLGAPACTPATTPAPAQLETVKPFEAADGERVTVMPLQAGAESSEPSAFGVVKFNDLPDMSPLWAVRMFGAGGGDPAANGLKTYLAFNTAHDGQGFLLGDFIDYRVVAASPGRIDLEITETAIGKGDQLESITRRAIVSWTEKPQAQDPNPEFPATVTITPAK
jgi:hypothetical protein